jgi:cytochrome c556
MKTWIFACVSVLVFGLTVAALANDEGDKYDAMFMKPAIAANGAMQKDVMGDLGAAAMDAAKLQAAFANIEKFWAAKNVDDAVMFAKNIQKVAGDVKDAAGKGDKDGAAAAAKMIGANCGGCHMAHRMKTDAGFDLH